MKTETDEGMTVFKYSCIEEHRMKVQMQCFHSFMFNFNGLKMITINSVLHFFGLVNATLPPKKDLKCGYTVSL
jgi:hypothetical protein